ncbi:RF-1 domain-containing protein [Xylaria sp. FL1777]|nr:RF-1 domain-containing protein [Xylaria sp. FL1777]
MTSKTFLRAAHTCKTALSTRHVTLLLVPSTQNNVWKGGFRVIPNIAFQRREFSNTNSPPLQKLSSKNLPPRPKPPPEEEIEESFLKGSGPGGQKINKTNSAVQLKHIPTGVVIKCQATRSRSQNRTIARRLLADKLDDMSRGDESRSSVVGEFKRKKKASSAKKSRRKYRKLDEEKGAATEDAENSTDLFDEELPEKAGETADKDSDAIDTAMLDKKQQQTRI